jgi:exodeoxyribonuclease-3
MIQRLRVVSFNANGLRAAGRNGFFGWFARQKADILCVQELKAKPEQIDDVLYMPRGFHRHLACADKPGYSGVAIYCRREPDDIICGYGDREFDAEGRYVEARFADIDVASVYFPSGSSSEARQAAKFRFLASFESHLKQKLAAGKPYIFCGDVNIAHKMIDLRNWRSNQKNSGFTPEERAWMDKLTGEIGFVDAFRVVNQKPDQYTWWSQRGNARANNVGWRIDYHLVSPNLGGSVERASIYTGKYFSDHAPLTIDYGLSS